MILAVIVVFNLLEIVIIGFAVEVCKNLYLEKVR